jgi:putative sigma-54 modulation protein
MKIHYSLRHIKLTKAIEAYVAEKIGSLDRLDEHAFGAHVVLFHDESHGAGQYHCKVHVAVPGNDLHAETRCPDLYEAIDKVVDKVSQQLRKHKTKLTSKRTKASTVVRKTVRGKV